MPVRIIMFIRTSHSLWLKYKGCLISYLIHAEANPKLYHAIMHRHAHNNKSKVEKQKRRRHTTSSSILQLFEGRRTSCYLSFMAGRHFRSQGMKRWSIARDLPDGSNMQFGFSRVPGRVTRGFVRCPAFRKCSPSERRAYAREAVIIGTHSAFNGV